MVQQITIDLETLYGGDETAKLANLSVYEDKAREIAGNGNAVTLTGQGPIWLYLKIAHALHGKAARLCYHSPVTGEVVIFDHSPF